MKRLLLLLILSFFVTTLLPGQDVIDVDKEKYLQRREGYKFPNVLKINTLALPFNNISLGYERGILPRFSIVIAGSYKYKGGAPSMLNTEGDLINTYYDDITGFGISPEFRYYLKSCEDRYLEGFYAGLYFKWARYATGAKFDYSPEGLAKEFYNADLDLGEYGVGIQLGYQLVLWQRLNIDFMFFGPRYSKYRIGYEFDQEVSQAFLDDLSNEVNEVLQRFGFDYDVELKQSGESRASHSFSFTNVRFGIGLGFAF